MYFCLAPKCPGDLVYSTCHSRCPPQCNNSGPDFCAMDCVAGCGCSPGLFRDGDRCYKKNDCPQTQGEMLIQVNNTRFKKNFVI